MDLVIQAPAITFADAKAVAKLSGASSIERLSGSAFRLRGAVRETGVADYCARAQLDFSFVSGNPRLADIGLLAMDMDSTLITIECIDEIADLNGLKPQVAAITAAAMRGEVDFAESLARRVALLRGLEEGALQRVYDERLSLSPGAEQMLAAMRRAGIKTLLVSGGFTFFTERLKMRLGIDFTASNQLEIRNGKLTGKLLGQILGANGKAAALIRARNDLGLTRDRIMAIGDGANDIPMLGEAGISIAYHAKPVVRERATYALNQSGLDGVLNLFD
ncbi:MAG: phosphoserine phosphatase SerB [Burkholderiales bacterium]|nr:phosphoserine phosphatase SerB [Burkholderiales bacterium]MDQ3196715.1 phosphoserine phosphatase SerB [Pseudomonadota bacterium]